MVNFKVKPCLHINTSDMEPEPLPIILSREHGVEYLDTSLFISAQFYLNVIKWETEELAGLYPTTERLFQGNQEGPCYNLAGSLENMCRVYLPFKDANYFSLKLHIKKNRISLKWIYNQWRSLGILSGPWTRGHLPNPMSPTIQQGVSGISRPEGRME